MKLYRRLEEGEVVHFPTGPEGAHGVKNETGEPIPIQHFCFRVGEAEFDAILERIVAAGLAYRSTPHGPVDSKVNTHHGGRIVYWSEPDGHVWEMLTVSYARKPGS